MIQRVMVGDIEEEEHATLQKIGKKRHMKTNNLRIELPALNMALVEVYQEFAKPTRAVKDMVYNNKKAWNGAELAIQQWKESTTKLEELEHQLREANVKRREKTPSPITAPPPLDNLLSEGIGSTTEVVVVTDNVLLQRGVTLPFLSEL